MRRLIILGVASLLSACTGLFFYPTEQHALTPDKIGLTYKDVWLNTEDKIRLHGWFLPASGQSCGTVLFLHGNALNVSAHIASVYWLPAHGFNVFMVDYRGYGASGGVPSLTGLQTDVEAALRYLSDPERGDNRIAVFGQSLGAAAAIYGVARSPYRTSVRAVVVEGTFSSHREIAREKLSGLWLTWPLQWLPDFTVSDDYGAISAVADVAPIPLLLIHGEDDTIIPIAHSERLFAAAKDPKEFWKVPKTGHIGTFKSDEWRERLVSFLSERLCPQPLKADLSEPKRQPVGAGRKENISPAPTGAKPATERRTVK